MNRLLTQLASFGRGKSRKPFSAMATSSGALLAVAAA